MPDYKKKTHRFLSPKGKKVKREQEARHDIPMKPLKKKKEESPLKDTHVRIVSGKKLENKRKMRIILYAVVAVVLSVAILWVALPGGLFENISNLIAMVGSGSYPKEIYGTETIDSEAKSGYYYVLTDTNLYAYSNGGKEILSVSHGFSNPVLRTSETRALVYDQGGTSLHIYNLQKKVKSIEAEAPIICAAISRSGAYAIATESKNYTSTVTVFSKRDKTLYEWNAAKDIINNIAISPFAKKIAVTTLNASDGQASSKLMVFNFKSADPLYSFDYEDKIVYDLSPVGNGFSAITTNGYGYISWSNFKKRDITSELELNMLRRTPSGTLLVFNRSSDRSDNIIMLVSSSGKKKAEVEFSGIISDVALSKGHIYCISDLKAYILNKKGETLKTGVSEYGCKRIAVIGNNAVAEITDQIITKIDIDNKE